jgi:hypothetical protein
MRQKSGVKSEIYTPRFLIMDYVLSANDGADILQNYHNKRDDLAAIADYIVRKRAAWMRQNHGHHVMSDECRSERPASPLLTTMSPA